MITLSAAAFNREPSRAKAAAAHEHVLITEHGRPAFVLMPYADYARLAHTPDDLAGFLEMDDDTFDAPVLDLQLTPADL